jgi:hypothetical protein
VRHYIPPQNSIDLRFKGWYRSALFRDFIKERRDGVNSVRNFSGELILRK